MIDKKLTSNLHTIILNEYENTEGIVILEAGQIVFEEYFGNSNSKSKIHIASVTKSILSALIGIAIEKGYIKSTEGTVMGYFPEYTSISSNDTEKKIQVYGGKDGKHKPTDWLLRTELRKVRCQNRNAYKR